MEPTSTVLVDKLREWETLGKNKRESFEKIVEIFGKEYPLIDSDYNAHPMNLLLGIIKIMIKSERMTSNDIMNIANYYISNTATLNTINRASTEYMDVRRVEINHEIICKRFKNMGMSLAKDDSEFKMIKSDYNFIPMYQICQKLDTYNIGLPEKINLMIEEIAYRFDKIDSEYRPTKEILLTVFSYIFAIYSGEDVPEDNILKVITAAINKLEASVYLNIKLIGNSQYKYINGLTGTETIDSNKQRYINIIAQYQKSGKINTHFKDMMKELGERVKSSYDITDILNLIYLYFVFTDKYKQFKDESSCKDCIKAFAKTIIESNRFFDAVNMSKMYIQSLMGFQFYLKHDIQSDDKTIAERALKVVKDITKVIEDIREYIDDYNIKVHATPMTDDKEDDGLGFQGMSDYEKDVLKKFTESVAVFEAMTIDQDAFEQTYGNPEILAECDDQMIKTITDFVIENPKMINEDVYMNALDSAYKIVSTNLFKDDKINPNYISKLSTLKAAQGAIIDKNQEEMKSMLAGGSSNVTPYKDINITDMHTLEEFNINDINDIKKYLDTNQLAMAKTIREAECINSSAQIIIQEMKISSYVTLALDKAKKVFDTLNDKQKEAFTTIDRIAHSIESWDDKDERDDARMRVVNGKMLPALSKCFKTVLAVGALSYFVSIYLGILALVMKFVKAKNAEKRERQAIVDEIEVELEMIDKRISTASDNGNMKEERNLRLLKKKLATKYTQIALKNIDKWDNSVVMKQDSDATVSRFHLKED